MKKLVTKFGVKDGFQYSPNKAVVRRDDMEVIEVVSPQPEKKEIADIKDQNVTITEMKITKKDIERQQKELIDSKQKKDFKKTALEDLLIEDIEINETSQPLTRATVNKAFPKRIISWEKDEQEINEKQYSAEKEEKKKQLRTVRLKIDFERKELIKILRSLGEAPVISVVMEEGKEEEALKSIRRQKEEKKKQLTKKIIEDQESRKEIQNVSIPKEKEIRVYDDINNKKLKETVVYVRKGLSLKFTNEINKSGMFEVEVDHKGTKKEVKEFRSIEEFHTYAEELGFNI